MRSFLFFLIATSYTSFSQTIHWNWSKGNVSCPSQYQMMYGSEAIDHAYPNLVSPMCLEVDSLGNSYVYGSLNFSSHSKVDYLGQNSIDYVPTVQNSYIHHYLTKYDPQGNLVWNTILEGEVTNSSEIHKENYLSYKLAINPFSNDVLIFSEGNGDLLGQTMYVNGVPQTLQNSNNKILQFNGQSGEYEGFYSFSNGNNVDKLFFPTDETLLVTFQGGLNYFSFSSLDFSLTGVIPLNNLAVVQAMHPITKELYIQGNLLNNPSFLFNKSGTKLYECYSNSAAKCYSYPDMTLLWETVYISSIYGFQSNFSVDENDHLWVQITTLGYSDLKIFADGNYYLLEPIANFSTTFSFPLHAETGKPGIPVIPTRMLDNSYAANGFKTVSNGQIWAGNVYLSAQFGNDIHEYTCPNFAVPLQHYVAKVSYENVDLFESSVSLENLQKNNILVYPNPTSDILHVESLDQLSFESTIFSLEGKKLYHFKVGESIDLSNLEAGTYLLLLEGNSISKSTKIQKR